MPGLPSVPVKCGHEHWFIVPKPDKVIVYIAVMASGASMPPCALPCGIVWQGLIVMLSC